MYKTTSLKERKELSQDVVFLGFFLRYKKKNLDECSPNVILNLPFANNYFCVHFLLFRTSSYNFTFYRNLDLLCCPFPPNTCFGYKAHLNYCVLNLLFLNTHIRTKNIIYIAECSVFGRSTFR